MDSLPAEISNALIALESDYESISPHPIGANGYLFFAKNRISGKDVAFKFYYGAPGERRHDEPKLLASINSPNVLQIIDARNLSNEWAFFITPRCYEGDLDTFIETKPSVTQAIDMALGICNGVSAIHQKNLIHRDLKPANIVCECGAPLIADFGSVRKLEDGEIDVPASGHSALYRPPEAFGLGRYSALGDIYQIGLVLYQLLGGALPYDPFFYFKKRDHNEYEAISDDFDRSKFQDDVLFRLATTGNLVKLSSLPPWIRRNTKDAIRAMTHPAPTNRISTLPDVVSLLTKIRSNNANWRWNENVAVLQTNGRTIEVRPLANGCFQAFQSISGGFRRVPSVPNGTLKELVERFS
jgi:serine/threonine protein kinase